MKFKKKKLIEPLDPNFAGAQGDSCVRTRGFFELSVASGKSYTFNFCTAAHSLNAL